MNSVRRNLESSIENLYKVFSKYPLKAKIEGCPCCVGKHDNRNLHFKNLRDLSGEDLSYYGFKAITTFGDVNDFKHFLPRLFEIVVEQSFKINDEIIFGKLEIAKWQSWKEIETKAVEDFFLSLFEYAINKNDDSFYFVEVCFAGIARAVKNVSPYLNLWFENITSSKIKTLKYFVIDEVYASRNAFLSNYPIQRKQVLMWLLSEDTISTLENLYFSSKDFKNNSDLGEVLEKIYELQNQTHR